MEETDKRINQIDNELLKLSKGQSHDFDFIKALSLFRDEFRKEVAKYGQNEYLEHKAAIYISVFNDLCNGIAKTISHTDIEYDDERQIAKVNVTTQEGSNPLIFETIERNVTPDAYQKGITRSFEINKYSSLNKSKVSFDRPEDAINTWFRALRKNESFDNFFTGIKGAEISFESYISDLVRESDKTLQTDGPNIEAAINEVLGTHVSANEKNKLEQLFKTNQSTVKIDWRKSADELVKCVDGWKQNDLIKLYGDLTLLKFLLENFTIKGKEIVIGSLRNALTRQNCLY